MDPHEEMLAKVVAGSSGIRESIDRDLGQGPEVHSSVSGHREHFLYYFREADLKFVTCSPLDKPKIFCFS